MWTYILPTVISLASGLGGYALHRAMGERRWKWIRAHAIVLLHGGEASTPGEAISTALLQSQLDRLAIESQKVADLFKPLEGQTSLPFPGEGEKP